MDRRPCIVFIVFDYKLSIISTTSYLTVRKYSRKGNTTYIKGPDVQEICQLDAIDITPDGGIVVVIDSKNRNLKTFVYTVWYRATYNSRARCPRHWQF